MRSGDMSIMTEDYNENFEEALEVAKKAAEGKLNFEIDKYSSILEDNPELKELMMNAAVITAQSLIVQARDKGLDSVLEKLSNVDFSSTELKPWLESIDLDILSKIDFGPLIGPISESLIDPIGKLKLRLAVDPFTFDIPEDIEKSFYSHLDLNYLSMMIESWHNAEAAFIYNSFIKNDEMKESAKNLSEDGWPLSIFLLNLIRKDGEVISSETLENIDDKIELNIEDVFDPESYNGLDSELVEELRSLFYGGFYRATYVTAAGYLEYYVVSTIDPSAEGVSKAYRKIEKELAKIEEIGKEKRVTGELTKYDHFYFVNLLYFKALEKHWLPVSIGDTTVSRHSATHGFPVNVTRKDALQMLLLLQAHLYLFKLYLTLED